MHFVPTKKEVYVICTQKFQKRTEKSRLFKNLHVFCTQLQNVETLSLPLNYVNNLTAFVLQMEVSYVASYLYAFIYGT